MVGVQVIIERLLPVVLEAAKQDSVRFQHVRLSQGGEKNAADGRRCVSRVCASGRECAVQRSQDYGETDPAC